MTTENTTPEKIKDIETALKDISTIYSAAFWRDKCRQLLSDRQALNDRVAELEAEVKRMRAVLAEIAEHPGADSVDATELTRIARRALEGGSE